MLPAANKEVVLVQQPWGVHPLNLTLAYGLWLGVHVEPVML